MYAKKCKLVLFMMIMLVAFYSFAQDQPTTAVPEGKMVPGSYGDPEIERVVVAQYEGTFTSKGGTIGNGIFVLFDDGTMEGEWSTENKSFYVKANGFYVIKNGIVYFSVFGEALLQSTTTARVLMNAGGRGEGNGLKGTYRVIVEKSSFKDDEGEWQAKMIRLKTQ